MPNPTLERPYTVSDRRNQVPAMQLDPLLANRYAVIQGDRRAGGMADVLKAVDTKAGGRPVAVKLFRPNEREEAVEREAYERELRALRDLKHPGIVELIDSGVDSQGRRFLVLEWIDRSLVEHLRLMPPGSGWDDIATSLVIPILRALDFAHGRGCIHRDLKPANILVTDDGIPKLADFGIAKLKQYLDQSMTLKDFCSPPFCPPEPDDGSHQYARDVFSFAALCAHCMEALDGRSIRNYAELKHAIDNLDTTPAIQDLLKRSIDPIPAERPSQAGVLLAELVRLQQLRNDQFERQVVCHLRLTPKTKADIRQIFETSDDREAQRLLLHDLGERPSLERYRSIGPAVQSDVGHYRLLGNTLSIHVARDADPAAGHLNILGIRQNDPSALDRVRDKAMPLLFQLRIAQPANIASAQAALDELERRLVEHEHARIERDRVTGEDALFGRWRRTLDAQEQLGRRRFPPIRYMSLSLQESYLELETDTAIVDDVIGTRWRIQTPTPPSPNGEVLRVENGRVLLGDLRFVHEHKSLPPQGLLLLDTFSQDQAVIRQRDTVDAVRHRRSGLVNVRLADLVLDPATGSPPVPRVPNTFFQELDDAKKEALYAAMGSQECLVVHGPPGTGKTRLIAEITLQALRSGSAKSVLLTSQTHVALDNAIERLQEVDPALRILRIGSPVSDKISPASQALLLDNQLTKWADEVLERGEKYLAKWASEHGLDHLRVQQAIWLQMYVAERLSIGTLDEKLSALRNKQIDIGGDVPSSDADGVPGATTRQLLDAEVEELGSRKSEAERRLRRVRDRLSAADKKWTGLRDMSAADLLGEAEALLPGTPNAKLLGGLVRLHPAWAERLGTKRGLEPAILAHYQVVAATCIGLAGVPGYREVDFDLCVLDEASKATATEALVPLARSRRWILVGDQRQLPPYQEDLLRDGDLLSRFQLTESDVKETLFDRLISHLPGECQKTLSVQHRMVKPIGSLISECFYSGRVESAGPVEPPWVSQSLGAPVTWWSTANAAGRFEVERGLGWANPLEAEIVSRLLERLQQALPATCEQPKQRMSVVVLSGYLAQRRELERRIDSLGPRLSKLDIEVNTVDAYQGQEAGVAIFSVVRSNSKGAVGFLKEFSRLNVALSRGRYALALVGDHAFCRNLREGVPGRVVAEYFDRHPPGCRLVDWVKAK